VSPSARTNSRMQLTGRRYAGLLLAAQCASTLVVSSIEAQQSPSEPPLVAWARAHGTRLRVSAADCKDFEPLLPRLANARVIGLGELIHDAHELHLLRNRLARCLATSGWITAIALESGLADMAPLHNALLQPPRSVVALTRERISYGWGGLPEIQALTEWIRSHNATQPFERRIRLYGMDVTGPDGFGRLNRAHRSIEELMKYLRSLEVPRARGLSNKLKPYLQQVSETTYATLSPAARESLRSLLDSAEKVVRSPPGGSSEQQSQVRGWGTRSVVAVRQVLEYLELRTRLGRQPSSSPEFPRLVQMRDSMMADNLLWALDQQPSGGRILVLAHNAHLFRQVGPTTLRPPLQYTTVGQHLQRKLGSSYVVIGTDARALGYYLEEQDSPRAQHLASMLGGLGRNWLSIDLRAAAEDPALASWLRQPRQVRFQWGFQWIRPAVAADLLIIADSLSPTSGEIR
jgi:erythromycin esterase